MKRGGCLKTIFLIWVCSTLLGLIISGISSLFSRSANETQPPAATAVAAAAQTQAPSVTGGLAAYADQARALALDLDSMALESNVLRDFNDRYVKGDYTGAYAYYQSNMSAMRQSCWAMNNVGLAMLQLQKNEDALVLYMAIQFKARESQPESLINLLIAGHALGFSPKELMDAVDMDAGTFQRNLESKAYDQYTIDGMIRSLCYNIIYMRMEEPTVGTGTAGDAPDIDGLLAADDPSALLMEELRSISSTDQDVQELLAYFEALIKQRGGNDVI